MVPQQLQHMHSDLQAGKRIKLHEGHEDLLDTVEAVCSRTFFVVHMWDVSRRLIINHFPPQVLMANGGAAFESHLLVSGDHTHSLLPDLVTCSKHAHNMHT